MKRVDNRNKAHSLGSTDDVACTAIAASSLLLPAYFTLPVPPSWNRATKIARNRTGSNRPLKQEAKDWIMYAKREVRAQMKGVIAERCIIVLNVERKSLQSDVDNRTKLLFDVLVKAGALADDSLITAFAISWSDFKSNMVRLAILPVSPLVIEFHPSAKSNGACGGWFLQAPSNEEEKEAA